MRVGLFGGSFDPIHAGHVEPVRAARAALGLERVFFLPTAHPPHKSGRLVAPDEGAHSDDDDELVAEDVGFDGAAASAEEAAVHVVDDEENFELDNEDEEDLPSYENVDLGDVTDPED